MRSYLHFCVVSLEFFAVCGSHSNMNIFYTDLFEPGTTTPCQSEPGNVGVLYTPQISRTRLTNRCNLVSYFGHSLFGDGGRGLFSGDTVKVF